MDLYEENLRLFVDVRGREHRIFPNLLSRRYRQTYEQFCDLIERDDFKIRRCEEEGIHCIIVDMPMRKDKLRAYLTERLSEIYG
jgi:hypothetical protein